MVTNDWTHDFNNRLMVINYYSQTCGSKERLISWFFKSVLHHTLLVLSSEISGSLFSSSSVLVSLALVKTMAEKSQLFTWTSGGDSHCRCPKFHCHYYQRHQNMYPHITHTKCRSLSGHSYAKPWLPLKKFRQENREGMWMTGLFVAVLWF